MTRWLPLVLFTIAIVGFALTGSSAVAQNMVPQNLNGTYAGQIWLRNKNSESYLMSGPALLAIKNNQFILCKNVENKCSGKPIKGFVTFSTIPEKANLGIGHIRLETNERIEVRWQRDASLKSFRIVQAHADSHEFRFCSNLNEEQCSGKI